MDPRIAKFKTADKEKRLAIKRAKHDAIRQREEQEQQQRIKKEQEDKERKEREDAELKERLAREKKEKEQIKKELKVERKSMRTLCKESDYFITDEKDRVQAMMDVETLCDGLQLLRLRDLVGRVKDNKTEAQKVRNIIKQEVNAMRNGTLENINLSNNLAGSKTVTPKTTPMVNGTSEPAKKKTETEWSPEELQLLIKAVNLFPAGTAKRLISNILI